MARRWVELSGMVAVITLVSGCSGGDGDPLFAGEPGVSGVIDIEARSRVDSDTADDIRLDPNSANSNSARNPQSLPAYVTLGGYVSALAGNYAEDLVYAEDPSDHYRIELSDGDTLALHVFGNELEAPAADPQLEILDETGELVYPLAADESAIPPFVHGVERPEGDSSGTYDIAVKTGTSSGPFRYVLTVSRGVVASNTFSYSEPELLPNQAVVTLVPAQAGTLSAASTLNSLGVDGMRHLGGGSWQVSRNSAGTYSVQNHDQAVRETLDWIEQLNTHGDIDKAEPNYLFRAQNTSIPSGTNPLYERLWNYPLINLPTAWQAVPEGGQGVGVAVMDTGLFSNTPGIYGEEWHPDIDANVLGFRDLTLDYVNPELDIDFRYGDPVGRDSNPADPGDGWPQSSNFHGTHVAGIVSAVDNNLGIVGVAPKSTLIPVRVLGEGGVGSAADLIAAINWATLSNDVDVINLSLGGLGNSSQLESAIDTAYRSGKLIVAAAGNEQTSELTYPAAYSQVVGVGAVDAAKRRAYYSNVGGSVDLVAPGGDVSRDADGDGDADIIISTWGTDDNDTFVPGYAGLQGTSMAAPHVTGVYALMKSAALARGEGANVNPESFFQWLIAGALTEEVGNQNEYGAGLIDALKSVEAVLGGESPIVVGASPSTLSFTSTLTEQTVDLTVYPEGEAVTSASVGALPDWLNVASEPSLVPPTQLTVSVDVSQLDAEESYTSSIVISYEGGNESRKLTIPVAVQLGDPEDTRDAGRHYVLLVSPDENRETLHQQAVTATGGAYQFSFDDIEPGEYFLVAGTDNDNNGVICENGEACAEYPVNGLPEKISIGEERVTGVMLSTSFRRPTISAMGRPRYGFEGYQLESRETDDPEPVRRVEANP